MPNFTSGAPEQRGVSLRMLAHRGDRYHPVGQAHLADLTSRRSDNCTGGVAAGC
ncbi:hypothetical protein [Amycolatopsis magusensis]|uniref:hypothetical protein n=1 Tax=Amycolatopsis magusensis TaxID=882444 RepID=UPI0037983DE7